MKKNFVTFSNSICFKINMFSSLIFMFLFSLSVFFIKKINLQAQQSIELTNTDNAIGAFMLTTIIGFLIGLILFIYSIVIPLVIPLFTKFSNNFKSILGLLVCNIMVTFFLYINFTAKLALFYAIPVFIGIFITLNWRYTINNKVK